MSKELPDLLGLDQLQEYVLPVTSDEAARTTVVSPEDPSAMKLGAFKAMTKARVGYMVADLTAGLMPDIKRIFLKLEIDSPKAALDFYLELLKFSTPQMKHMAVERQDGDGPMRARSLRELQGMILDEQGNEVTTQ